MKVYNHGSNQTEVVNNSGSTVLVSYSTPVAAKVLDSDGVKYYRTESFHSVTTSKHINKWFSNASKTVEKKPQSFFEELMNK